MNDKGIITVGYPNVLLIIGTHCKHAIPKKKTLAIFVFGLNSSKRNKGRNDHISYFDVLTIFSLKWKSCSSPKLIILTGFAAIS
jgi:hypothetical protein